MDFTTLFTGLQTGLETTMSNYSLAEIMTILLGTFVLSAWVGLLYRRTHKGANYNQGYVQTLVVMGGIIAMIMLIVGSDVAKAFTMMGAFSIIRFRNNMKETRDIGFIFLVMAIGMAMGTKLYLLAGLGTVIMSLVIFMMYRFNRFSPSRAGKLLTIRIEPQKWADGLFEQVFEKYQVKAELLSVDAVKKENLIQISFAVSYDQALPVGDFLSEIQSLNEGQKVSLGFL